MKSTRGILNPALGLKNFNLSRFSAEGVLSEFVEAFWFVEWQMGANEQYLSETIPFPVVHVVFEKDKQAVHGVVTKKFSRLLAGIGRAVGIKFRPAMFYPFINAPVSELTDRTIDMESVFGTPGTGLQHAILDESAQEECVKLCARFFEERLPDVGTSAKEFRDLVEMIAKQPEITRVQQVARVHGCGLRQLQINFKNYVGVSPKWVIMRYRVQEAAELIASGKATNMTELALQLGYFDQAHFIRDFRAVVGKSPKAYLADQRKT